MQRIRAIASAASLARRARGPYLHANPCYRHAVAPAGLEDGNPQVALAERAARAARRWRDAGCRGRGLADRGGAVPVARNAVARPPRADAGEPLRRKRPADPRPHGEPDRAARRAADAARSRANHPCQCRRARGAGRAHPRAGRARRPAPSRRHRPARPARERHDHGHRADRAPQHLASLAPPDRRAVRDGRTRQPHRRGRHRPRPHGFRRQCQPRAVDAARLDNRICRNARRSRCQGRCGDLREVPRDRAARGEAPAGAGPRPDVAQPDRGREARSAAQGSRSRPARRQRRGRGRLRFRRGPGERSSGRASRR